MKTKTKYLNLHGLFTTVDGTITGSLPTTIRMRDVDFEFVKRIKFHKMN